MLPGRRKATPPNTIDAAAYHEAGHVVTALSLGGFVSWASIDPNPPYAKVPGQPGACAYDFFPFYGGNEWTDVLMAQVAERVTMAKMAGSRAEIIYKGDAASLVWHRGSAVYEVEQWPGLHFASMEDGFKYVDRMDRQVAELLVEHWVVVREVARTILERTTLMGYDIKAIVKQVLGDSSLIWVP